MTIPTNPAPGSEWTNDVTGVIYRWDGDRWVIVDNTEDIDLSEYVSQQEFETDQNRQDDHDNVQDNQINALETQLQLLAQTQAVGKWTYQRNINGGSVRPPASATFYATHQDGAATVLLNWADARLVMISKTDIDGKQFVFTEFEEGDKMEVLATDGSSACYGTVTNQPTQEAYGNLIIAVERSQGGPSEGKEYILSVYRPGASAGDADLDVLDGRYLVKTGDTMEGILRTEGEVRFELPNGTGGVSRMRLMATKKDDDGNGGNSFQFTSHPEPTGILSNAKVHIQLDHTEEDGPITKLRWLADPNQDDNAISLGYANNNYLQLSGGTLDGTLNFKRGTKDTQQFKISPNSSDDFATNIYSFNNGQMRFRTTQGTDEQPYDTHIILDQNSGSPETKIYKVITPTKDDMAANKAYVDDNTYAKPPGLLFRQQSGDHADSVDAGYFRYAYDDTDGEFKIRVSHTTYDGITWNSAPSARDYSFNEGHRFTIYNQATRTSWYLAINGTYNRMDFHDDHVLIYISSQHQMQFPTTNVSYFLSFTGLF